jgi:hypothetical protein
VSTSSVPALFAGLVDDAAVFPPGGAPLPRAVVDHRRHRTSWYADFVGPLLVQATSVSAGELQTLIGPDEGFVVGLIGDTGIERLAPAAARLAAAGIIVRQVEVAVAKRGEDPLPGLDRLLEIGAGLPGIDLYAEIPLTWGLLGALDAVAQARRDGAQVTAKFRTGGLAAELFPTPAELAAVICACQERGLAFKLTAGLHRAIRHNDPETGFTHHGFVNILAGALAAADGSNVGAVTQRLAATDPVPLIEAVRGRRTEPRPLWTGFGSCSISEPLDDLRALGLLVPDGVPDAVSDGV